mmetsp:Transcript_8524/g.23036  ORF Transcript_8524/g.23036 Transcript_8524/m.23036 type:complete len:151 (-) Transcript_8524:43-495(-)
MATGAGVVVVVIDELESEVDLNATETNTTIITAPTDDEDNSTTIADPGNGTETDSGIIGEAGINGSCECTDTCKRTSGGKQREVEQSNLPSGTCTNELRHDAMQWHSMRMQRGYDIATSRHAIPAQAQQNRAASLHSGDEQHSALLLDHI